MDLLQNSLLQERIINIVNKSFRTLRDQLKSDIANWTSGLNEQWQRDAEKRKLEQEEKWRMLKAKRKLEREERWRKLREEDDLYYAKLELEREERKRMRDAQQIANKVVCAPPLVVVEEVIESTLVVQVETKEIVQVSSDIVDVDTEPKEVVLDSTVVHSAESFVCLTGLRQNLYYIDPFSVCYAPLDCVLAELYSNDATSTVALQVEVYFIAFWTHEGKLFVFDPG